MSDSIGLEKKVSTACTVFKIDFRGRLVYIDDETEELFGLGREELFGKSLYEFAAPDSIEAIDEILKKRKRFESFYEAMTLVLRVDGGEYKSFDTVVTLNFITGNPVNFQFTLLPGSTGKRTGHTEYHAGLLELLNGPPNDIETARLTALMGQTAGYREGHCYRVQANENLELIASWPEDVPSRAAAAYLNQFIISGLDRFSFIDSDKELCDGFGDGKSEAVLLLNRTGADNLIIHLYGPTGYKPAQQRLDLISSFCGIWRDRNSLLDDSNSVGQQLSLMGGAADAVGLATLISNPDGELLYHNSSLSKLISSQPIPEGTGGLSRFLDSLHLVDDNGKPIKGFELVGQAGRPKDSVRFNPYISSMGNLYLAIEGITVNNDNLQVTYILPESRIKVNAIESPGEMGTDLLAVAHDLNAPLITIESFAHHLQKSLDKKLSSDDRFAISSIIENSSALSRMLEGLKEISSFRTSTDSCERLALPEIVKQIIKSLRAAYPNVKYEVAIEKNLPFINAPRHKIERILRNILDNSFKYSSEVNSPRITLTSKKSDEQFVLEISDNGPGIEPEYQTKIYEPFFRCPETMVLPGTGIGLAISRDISQSLGGDITFVPSETGAKFLLSLPKSVLQFEPTGISLVER